MVDYTLPKIDDYDGVKGPVLLMVLDGFGVNDASDHNCVTLAKSELWDGWVEQAKKANLYCELKAHGTAVGLPDDTDMVIQNTIVLAS